VAAAAKASKQARHLACQSTDCSCTTSKTTIASRSAQNFSAFAILLLLLLLLPCPLQNAMIAVITAVPFRPFTLIASINMLLLLLLSLQFALSCFPQPFQPIALAQAVQAELQLQEQQE
jgi:hypothetical protein